MKTLLFMIGILGFSISASAYTTGSLRVDYRCEGGNYDTGIMKAHLEVRNDKAFIDGVPLKWSKRHEHFVSSRYPTALIDFHTYAAPGPVGGGVLWIGFPGKWTATLLCRGLKRYE